jgi:hypothetical protein
MVFDTDLGMVVLFGGGITDDNNVFHAFNDLWAWDGTTWSRIG